MQSRRRESESGGRGSKAGGKSAVRRGLRDLGPASEESENEVHDDRSVRTDLDPPVEDAPSDYDSTEDWKTAPPGQRAPPAAGAPAAAAAAPAPHRQAAPADRGPGAPVEPVAVDDDEDHPDFARAKLTVRRVDSDSCAHVLCS